MIAVKSFLHPLLLCKNKLHSMLCSTDQTQSFCNVWLVSHETSGTTVAGLRSCALSLLWKAGSCMGSISPAVLTYHPLISFHLASIREGLAPVKSTFHTPCWMCQESFFTVGPPMSCQDCTSLPCTWFTHMAFADWACTKMHYSPDSPGFSDF